MITTKQWEEIKEKITVKREHAYLLPKGCKLPFPSKGKIFYMSERSAWY